MIDVQLLQQTIRDKGMTTVAVCRKSGILKQTLYNRYNNPDGFKVVEINALKDALHLTEREYKKIFFA